MKRNFFGEPVAQPGDTFDDLALAIMEAKTLDDYPTIVGAYASKDPELGYCVSLSYESGDYCDEMQAHGFESKDVLTDWLADVPDLTFGMLEWVE